MRRKSDMDNLVPIIIDSAFDARVKRVVARRNSRLTAGYLISHNVDGFALARDRAGGGPRRSPE